MAFKPQIVARQLGGSSGVVGSEYFACGTRGCVGWSSGVPWGGVECFYEWGSRATDWPLSLGMAVIGWPRIRCPVDLGKAIHTCFLSIVASSASRAAVCHSYLLWPREFSSMRGWVGGFGDRPRPGWLEGRVYSIVGCTRRKVSGSAEMRREEDETRQDFSPSSRTKTEGNTAPDWTFARKNVREPVVQPRRRSFAVP